MKPPHLVPASAARRRHHVLRVRARVGRLGIQEFVDKKLIRTFPTTSAIGFAQG